MHLRDRLGRQLLSGVAFPRNPFRHDAASSVTFSQPFVESADTHETLAYLYVVRQGLEKESNQTRR